MALSKKQRKELEANKFVSKVTEKQIHYTYEFKLFALNKQSVGFSPNEVFIKAKIPPEWFRKNYAKNLLKGWRARVREKGIHSLKPNSGRPIKLKPPFEIDFENMEKYDNYELLQIIEYQKKLDELKKKSETPYTNAEWSLEAHIMNYDLVELDDND